MPVGISEDHQSNDYYSAQIVCLQVLFAGEGMGLLINLDLMLEGKSYIMEQKIPSK